MTTAYQVRADSAFGFSRDTRTWGTIDVTQPLNTLCSNYQLFEVGVSALGTDYTFFNQYHLAELQNRSDTLQDWLNTKAGVAIPTLKPGLPKLEFTSAHYQSINADTPVETHLCPPGYHYTQDFDMADAHDVVVLCDDEWKDKYRNGVLYNINGQWVPHQADSVGVRLTGAGNIVRRANTPDIGCMVFSDLGNVKTYPISGLTMNKLDVTRDYYSTLMLSLPDSITGKTVGYVIGGILHWLPPSGYFSDKAIMLAMPNLNLARLVLETRRYYDWDSIGVGDLSTPTSVQRIRNSETLKALLTHESSFVFTVDNPYVEKETIGVNHNAVWGRFYLKDPNDIDGEKPLGPLINRYGKCVAYWPTWEEGEWVFNTTFFDRENYLLGNARWQNQNLVNDAQAIVGPFGPYGKVFAEMHRFKARKK
ncbi:hypothetical protein pEaSNUABM29_00262 [Erwinia phage pEa_SNUABM_29]|nr:hypothetical protein pEaSNUABM29_00262 [Erwinia phage pEa_SNUABM_29]